MKKIPNIWVRLRDRMTEDGRMFEARVDLLPDLVVFDPSADKAYAEMCELIPEAVEAYMETHGKLPWSDL